MITDEISDFIENSYKRLDSYKKNGVIIIRLLLMIIAQL